MFIHPRPAYLRSDLLFSTQKSSHSSYQNGCVPLTSSIRSSSPRCGRHSWQRSPVPPLPGPGTEVKETKSSFSRRSPGGSGRLPRPSAPGKPAVDFIHGGTGAAAGDARHCACSLAPPARSRKRSSQPAGPGQGVGTGGHLGFRGEAARGEEVVGWGPE